MPQRHRAPYAPAFRRQMIELVRSGRDPEQLAREFRTLGAGDPQLGRPGRPGRGPPRGWSDYDRA